MKSKQLSLDFIKQLKQQILASRYVVAKIANAEMLRLYFSVGRMVENEFQKNKWGAKVNDEIATRLQKELPGLRGFSGSNIRKMRLFFQGWSGTETICPTLSDKFKNREDSILPTLTSNLQKEEKPNSSTPSSQLENAEAIAFFSISFSHHYEILLHIKNEADRWYYIRKTAQSFWTVRHLRAELNNQSHLQVRQFPNNFVQTMPDILSNKAMKAFKDQYLLDFVNIEDVDDEMDERVLEREIVLNIKKFLMSLGNDFTFMGNQYRF